jgi:hypothetical protein
MNIMRSYDALPLEKLDGKSVRAIISIKSNYLMKTDPFEPIFFQSKDQNE